MKKLSRSLQTKYLVLIISAMFILPIAFPLASFVVYLPALLVNYNKMEVYQSEEIESEWHEKAMNLQNRTDSEIIDSLKETVNELEHSTVFWVDNTGKTRFASNEEVTVPEVWNASDIVSFMKESYGGDPFTVVSFIGEEKNGFIVLQIDRKYMDYPIQQLENYFEIIYAVVVGLLLLLFIILFWLFFRAIQKRIVRLQSTMDVENQNIPSKVTVGEMDELGQLEDSFNKMIERLEAGRLREQEEEKLRKELIANLSHDLRTPLATIRAHAYSLKNEDISPEGQESITIIDKKIDHIHTLIENLLSYTLLSSGKYTYKPKEVDVNRAIRLSLSAWYPIFEKEGLEVDIQLFEKTLSWRMDPNWFERILDNLFQNVVRHAKSGKYVGILCEEDKIIIKDHGPGMKNKSEQSGVGIGLSIIELMTKEMGMIWTIDSSNEGTTITISKP
ncbi:HAMP domain-containing sensor histidine kinase [Metabacillus litoralis]|uniref:HAMP domain-containing sensor histidine kinase n=1 Tax=Metabacillus litoralis TaxID=152268 RepID=UPI00203F69C9|nr:HAMP domain-containing sensor histidine kinase [Metabacillus litoralis]MCM3409305.1 HAMP domain-containing histidine kinase [Metabacillus litoralis]